MSPPQAQGGSPEGDPRGIERPSRKVHGNEAAWRHGIDARVRFASAHPIIAP
jgi:hypothetical protein